MPLSRDDILTYARRYVADNEVVDFPVEGDLFAFLLRPADPARPEGDDTGWLFGGYGVCRGYELDTESKIEGKWVWMRFVSLLAYPPAEQHLKLQPPHVARGRFSSADRAQEVRITKVDPAAAEKEDSAPDVLPESGPSPKAAEPTDPKILQFRPRRS